jgi:hypothetical protein
MVVVGGGGAVTDSGTLIDCPHFLQVIVRPAFFPAVAYFWPQSGH